MRRKSLGSSVYLYRIILYLYFMILLLVNTSCLTSNQNTISQDATLDAIGIQQTQLSGTGTTLAEIAEQNPIQTPVSTQTQLSLEPTQAETLMLEPIATLEENPPTIEIDERLLKSAKILVFEDMSASRHIRYVKEALDLGDYFYLDVGSATGWFKTHLLYSEDWDLIIAAAEARRVFGGEFFQFIDDRVKEGASAIIEYWDWDAATMGKQKSLLDRCGVSFQADWYEPDLRVFYWLDATNPLFHYPNQIPNQLQNAERLWEGDIGDLFQIKYKNGEPVGDAILLAGTNVTWKDDHGVLVSCLDGRVILQGFSSHEYQRQDIVPLWENYIYHTLKNHFAVTGKRIPTPVVTSSAITPTVSSLDSTPVVLTPGSEYLFEHDCGGIIEAQLIDAPVYQKDLFEHHAKGVFLILKLEIDNFSEFPIQIWDEDYYVYGIVDGKEYEYSPNKAATGYLYIESPANLSQDLIQPGEHWRTRIAFDVEASGRDWVFVIAPGKEFNQQVCEVRIPLSK